MNYKTSIDTKINTLLIGSFPTSTESIRASLESIGHHVDHINSLSEFEDVLKNNTFDLIVSAVGSSRFTIQELFEFVSLLSPETPIVGYSNNPTPQNIVDFVRHGGADFFCIPEDLNILGERAQAVLEQSKITKETIEANENTLRLCNSMTEEIQRVSEENDTLCNDLANNHCETQKKIQQATIGAEFQALVNQELEIESMLRTALGYLLTRVGATNAAVYLHEGDTDWGIGAYINYDRQPEQFQTLVDTLGPSACPIIADDTALTTYKDGETFANLVGADSVDFSGSEVATMGCVYETRCMAAIILFRGDTKPFNQKCLDTLETIQEIFGYQLGTILKIHRRAESTWPSESIDDDEWNYGKAA